MNNLRKQMLRLLILILVLSLNVYGQHRGDNLAFQGLDGKTDNGVQAMAMAGAYTAMAGDISSLFVNPAGLARLNSFQISLSGNSSSKELWENQVYRPNRLYVTLPFYLEGLYVPDPANNGILDSKLALDSSYVVNPPEMGKDPLSKDAAEWSKKNTSGGFNSIALAFPMQVAGQHVVLAGAYSISNNIFNFDRNDTYLDPHIGSSIYNGFTGRQDGSDTLNVNWYRYLRQRDGTMKNINLTAAYAYKDYLNLSAGISYKYGSSKDLLQLDKVGYFGLIDENEFFFSYDTLNMMVAGESKYSQLSFELGLQYKIGAVSVGFHMETPATLKRDWNYSNTITDTSGTQTQQISGKDELSLPAKYDLGLMFHPAKAFIFSFDYGYTGYSKASFNLASQDSTHRNWKDQHSLRLGIQVKATDFLSLMAGYRTVSQVFTPDGAAFDSRGPGSTSWTMGVSLNVFEFGQINLAYEMRSLSYYDEYYSNTNYSTEKFNNMAISYTYKF